MRSSVMLGVAILAMAGCSSTSEDDPTTTAVAAATSTAPSTTTTELSASTTTTTTTTTSITSTTPAPVPTTLPPYTGPVTFDLAIQDETTPALPPAERGWDSSFSYSPWVVHHGGQFHMFYTGWGVNVAVGYAVSDDGLAFTRVGEDPVFSIREDIEGRTHFAEAPVVYVADDGTWVMYYGLLQGKRFPASAIHRATAPVPEGPWTRDQEPVYVAAGEVWDTQAVPQSLAVTEVGVFLYYDGRDGTNASSGLLFSPDGISFAPHDDPSTPYPVDPVIGVTEIQAWDGAGAGSPVVFATDDGFEMFYIGFEGPDHGERSLRIGYAVSGDGRNWQRFADNPVVVVDTQSSAPNSLGFPWMGGVKVDDTYYLYYALSAGAEGVGGITGTVEE